MVRVGDAGKTYLENAFFMRGKPPLMTGMMALSPAGGGSGDIELRSIYYGGGIKNLRECSVFKWPDIPPPCLFFLRQISHFPPPKGESTD